MKQCKNCVPRAVVLFLACFVVAFSISIPVLAAEPVDGSAFFSIRLDSIGEFSYPYDYNSGSDLVNSTFYYSNMPYDYAKFTSFKLLGGETYRLYYSIAWICFDFFVDGFNSNPYVFYRPDDASSLVNFSIKKHTRQYRTDDTNTAFILTESVEFVVPGAPGVPYEIQFNGSEFNVTSVTSNSKVYVSLHLFNIEKLSAFEVNSDKLDNIDNQLGEITTPTPEDNQQAGQMSGSVNDKHNQTDNISDRIESLQKPTVGTNGSGSVVIGGMQVDAMQQVDQQAFGSLTSVVGTIFGSTTIVSYFVIVFSMIFVSYVIFGKS